jgi:hypothetical protein
VTTPIVLPWPLQSSLEAATRVLFQLLTVLPSISHNRSAKPRSYRPTQSCGACLRIRVRFFIGGLTAVIMELAEPRMRTGV